MGAIFAVTRDAAELVGDSADISSLQAGRYADIVAVNDDSLVSTAPNSSACRSS